ncbi:HEAT repeat domain-containing protein, partial [Dyadobacter sp.]|uniref:HEAT repeat domain-containing protein n=1 Tax=Dyadobacter sp. TaxID=1914288 RepID=UPI003F72ED39
MKKFIYSILASSLLASQAIAQSDASLTSKIEGLISKLPAQNAAGLNKNMAELEQLGKPALVQIATMLTPLGKGDNTKIQYALGGFTYYASQAGKETARKAASEAYSEALGKVNDPDSKNFLMYQLQTVGKDESVDALKSYLGDERLAGPAARALARNGSNAAGTALFQALGNAKGAAQIAITAALGDTKFKEAAPEIEKTATSQDLALRKVSLYALSEIAVPSSEQILMLAAQKALYGYDESDATAVYLKYLANLAKSGNAPIAEKAALALIKNTPDPKQVGTRSSALKIYSDSKKRESVPVLVSALKSTDPEYRAAALKLGQKYLMANGAASWLAAMKGAQTEVQAEIITMLGHANSQDALPAIQKSLTSKDTRVKNAAIWAAGKIGQESSIPALINAAKTANAAEIKTIKSSLLTIKGASLTDQIAKALPALPNPAKAAMIDVLAARAASAKLPVVSAQLKSTDPEVRKAAFDALKSLAEPKDLAQLFTLLNAETAPADITAVQNAISAVVKGSGDNNSQTELVLKQMQAASAEKQGNYLPVLATIGGKKALTSVVSSYEKGDAEMKKVAISSLAAWSDANAAKELLAIAKKTSDNGEFEAAF